MLRIGVIDAGLYRPAPKNIFVIAIWICRIGSQRHKGCAGPGTWSDLVVGTGPGRIGIGIDWSWSGGNSYLDLQDPSVWA